MALKIGTRGSPLALAQAYETRDLLRARFAELAAEDAVEIVVLKTTGDKVQDRPLSEVGGKGVFTKELDEALFDGRIDCAAHSMKDVPTWLPDGIILPTMLEREDVRDVFISPKAPSFADLPDGALIGTTSMRRQALILAKYPKLGVTLFRGNVQTRLRKLDEGEADATMLALAGLNRLNMAHVATRILEPEEMLPAAGQGAIGLTCRGNDAATTGIISKLDHAPTSTCVNAERAMLDVLDGTCHTPIAGYAQLDESGEKLRIRGIVAEPDGSQSWSGERTGSVATAEAMARDLGAELRSSAGEAFFEALAE
jgi:hydroxymethylbilane synthase